MKLSNLSEKTECEAIKRQIELLRRFYLVIGDEYNTAEISMRYSLDSSLMPEDIFIYESIGDLGKKWFYEERIKPTIEQVEKPIIRLNELMEWNREYVIGTNGCTQIVKQEFRTVEFKEIYEVIAKQIQSLISAWKLTSEQFLLDTKDSSYRKYLFIHGVNKSIVIEFGNYTY